MAISFNQFNLYTQILVLLVLLVPHEADSISFNFSNTNPQNNQNTDITTTNDASITTGGIQLIPGKGLRAGRGMYNSLLHIWDNTSRELASFSTNFSFVISSDVSGQVFADGLAFFLAENNSVAATGGAMGLPVDGSTHRSLHKFVAVEFDTYQNKEWDPATLSQADYHTGINVNSLTSSVFKKWSIGISSKGARCQASVTYDSVSKNLSVFVSDNVNGVIDLSYIVDLRDVLPEWVIFGFTAGNFYYLTDVTISSWSFNSSNLQVHEQKAPSQTARPKKKAGHMVGLIAGLVVAALAFSAIIVFYYLRRIRNKPRRPDQVGHDAEMNKDFKEGTGPKRFSYKEILEATGHGGFADTNKLGEGGFGEVYKGLLKDQKTCIAVKRVSKKSDQGTKEYTAEVKIFGRLRHRNLVELKGWCHKKSELLLIYEYMKNGSLDLHLFEQRSWLTWDKRKRIANGLASALLYLHEGCKECILHRDIKSSNVMLDSNFDAKLGDFGLAKSVDHEKGSQATRVVGSRGYMAPEYLSTGKASKESDVFSFGVVALEIACGKRSIEYVATERAVILVEWVWDLYGTNRILEAVDPSIGSCNTKQIERLLMVGLWCAHPLANQRPSMEQAIQVLKHDDAPLPKLPSKMPKINSHTPPDPQVFYTIPAPNSPAPLLNNS